MRYKAYNKQKLCALMAAKRFGGDKNKSSNVSFWDFSKWPQWWEEGAKSLEKTSPGQIVTAPVRLPAALLTSTTQTVKEVPGTVKRASYALPFLAVAAALIGGGYLAYQTGIFKKQKKQVSN